MYIIIVYFNEPMYNKINHFFRHFNDNYIRNLKRKAKEGKRAPERISSGPLEIGNLALYTWKHKMIIPLKDSMLKLLLDEFDKLQQNVSMNASSCVITGVINSFIEVENYRLQRLEDPLEVINFFNADTLMYLMCILK